MSRIRVLVVDDSAFMRKMIPGILRSCKAIEVVGTAMDGLFALKKIEQLKPDVITLDVSMPRMDGIETLRHIVDDFGIPTIMVSSATKKDAELTVQALEIGAFDFVTKPRSSISLDIEKVSRELIEKVKVASNNPLTGSKIMKTAPPAAFSEKKPCDTRRPSENVLAIGISTGGPNALSYMLPQIPADFQAAILIVQHMPAGFTDMFASRLNSICRIEVKEARDGDLLLPGRALIAPGERHLMVRRMDSETIAVLSDSPHVKGHRPSADVLFSSVACAYGERAAGLIMTGMGDDGADGIGTLMKNGGLAIAQDEDSCVVFGMPKEAIRKHHIKRIVNLKEMGKYIIDLFSGKEDIHDTRWCYQTEQSI
jgi:two-component system chemotaxis response regulator CheB